MAVETRVLSSIFHPHIIKIRAICRPSIFKNGNSFFIMDRLYETLDNQLKIWYDETKFSIRKKLQTVMEIPSSIIHRRRTNSVGNGTERTGSDNKNNNNSSSRHTNPLSSRHSSVITNDNSRHNNNNNNNNSSRHNPKQLLNLLSSKLSRQSNNNSSDDDDDDDDDSLCNGGNSVNSTTGKMSMNSWRLKMKFGGNNNNNNIRGGGVFETNADQHFTQRLKYGFDISGALQHLHSHKILYRDL